MSARLPRSYWRFPAGPSVPATTAATDVFALLKIQCQRLTYWTLVESPNTGSTCLLLKPISAPTDQQSTVSSCSNMNVVITTGITGASAYRSPDTNTSNGQYRLVVGLTPDITGFSGSLGSGSFRTPQADRPFDFGTASPRWSGYWTCASTGSISASFILESPEALLFGFKDRSTSSGTMGGLVGCILETPTTGSGENDGRLFGMITGGTGIWNTAFWNSTSLFMGHQTGDASPHAGVFVVSGGQSIADTQWQLLGRMTYLNTNAGQYDVVSGSGAIRTETVWPVPFFCSAAPQRYMGRLRDVYVGLQDAGYGRLQVGASGTADLGFRVSTNSNRFGVVGDTLHFFPASGSGL